MQCCSEMRNRNPIEPDPTGGGCAPAACKRPEIDLDAANP